jgi:hypothetical protein
MLPTATSPRRARLVGALGALAALGCAVGLLAATGAYEEPRAPRPQGRIGSFVAPGGVRVRHASSMSSHSEADIPPASVLPGSACDPRDPLEVLFIGNSYTFYPSMPALVAEIAGSAGCQLEVTWATNGGYLLELHAHDPTTLATIHSRPWDVVVLQNQSQQPAYLPEDVSRESVPVVAELAREIYENEPSTKILYYSTWGRRDGDRLNCGYNQKVCTRAGHAEALEEGYALYAAATGGRMARVGRAFSLVAEDAGAPLAPEELYDPDGTHPSLLGSYLAAAVFFYELTGVSPEGLAFPPALFAHEAAYLQQIAAYTVEGVTLEETGATVPTREPLVARCDAATCAPDRFDGAASRVVLFEGTCSDWYLRSGVREVARANASLACTERGCTTGTVQGWARSVGDAIPPGRYSVIVSVDADASGSPSSGDVEACETGAFRVGRGERQVVSRFFPVEDYT